mgnify:CR=1 FL=1
MWQKNKDASYIGICHNKLSSLLKWWLCLFKVWDLLVSREIICKIVFLCYTMNIVFLSYTINIVFYGHHFLKLSLNDHMVQKNIWGLRQMSYYTTGIGLTIMHMWSKFSWEVESTVMLFLYLQDFDDNQR